jgi:hypothetical protein
LLLYQGREIAEQSGNETKNNESECNENPKEGDKKWREEERKRISTDSVV